MTPVIEKAFDNTGPTKQGRIQSIQGKFQREKCPFHFMLKCKPRGKSHNATHHHKQGVCCDSSSELDQQIELH
jgi:hypothetical protein